MFYITPNLPNVERKINSQFGEDGVIEEISRCMKISKGTFFEFGIGPSHSGVSSQLEGNFVTLRNDGWEGVFLDGAQHAPELNVRQEFVTALNINSLYKKHALPEDLDFMSVDVDGQEFWIWMSLQFRPKVMIIEINGGIELNVSKTVQFDVSHRWDGTLYRGASLLDMNKLAKSKGYVLVWSNGVNAIFICNEFVANPDDFELEKIYRP